MNVFSTGRTSGLQSYYLFSLTLAQQMYICCLEDKAESPCKLYLEAERRPVGWVEAGGMNVLNTGKTSGLGLSKSDQIPSLTNLTILDRISRRGE